MRGSDERQVGIFSYVGLEERIPQDHPLRAVRALVDAALRELDLHFAALYARRGRPSIAPEHLVRALLLMVLYSIRSERQGVHQEPGAADAGRGDRPVLVSRILRIG